MKIIVGFTAKTSAFWPNFFCAMFRHCAVVADGILMQIGTDGARLFRCGPREIRMLERAGWVFVELKIKNEKLKIITGKRKPHFSFSIFNFQFLTCVGFAKRALGIRNPFIWTPDQLFKYVIRNT